MAGADGLKAQGRRKRERQPVVVHPRERRRRRGAHRQWRTSYAGISATVRDTEIEIVLKCQNAE
jgi:hypothetical protein